MSAVCGCGAPVRWVRTETTGTLMPIDPDPTPGGNVVPVPGGPAGETVARVLTDVQMSRYLGHRYVAHWTTCPNADQYRRRTPAATPDQPTLFDEETTP